MFFWRATGKSLSSFGKYTKHFVFQESDCSSPQRKFKVVMGLESECKAWHMPPSGKLSVGVWKIRLREKWNMVKIDDSQ
jgi:hypothetical protein